MRAIGFTVASGSKPWTSGKMLRTVLGQRHRITGWGIAEVRAEDGSDVVFDFSIREQTDGRRRCDRG